MSSRRCPDQWLRVETSECFLRAEDEGRLPILALGSEASAQQRSGVGIPGRGWAPGRLTVDGWEALSARSWVLYVISGFLPESFLSSSEESERRGSLMRASNQKY